MARGKKKDEPPLIMENVNCTELRQLLRIQFGVRVAGGLPHELLLALFEGTIPFDQEYHDPLMHERGRVETWIKDNWSFIGNQLRCKGDCTTGQSTDAQVIQCFMDNEEKLT